MTSQPVSPPTSFPFQLQHGEEPLLVARRHRVYLFLQLGRDILFGLLPVIVLALIINWTTGFDGAAGNVLIGLIVLWLLFWAIRGYFTWYKYQNDLWVVTNQRLIDSMKANWFNHKLASADLVNVEDMSVERRGMFATMFRYGDLICQTAGARPNFVLSGIPNPADVLNLVDSARDKARRELMGRNIV